MPKVKRLNVDWINDLPFCSNCHFGIIAPGKEVQDQNVIRDYCRKCGTLNRIYYKDALPSLKKKVDKIMKEYFKERFK